MGCTASHPESFALGNTCLPSPDTYCDYSDLVGPGSVSNAEYFRTRPEQKRSIHFAKIGCGSKEQVPPETLIQGMRMAVALHGNDPALSVERPSSGTDAPESTWATWTWQQYYAESCKFAKALMHVGTQRYEGVTIWGFNSPEWVIAFMGSTFAGAIPAGIYPTDTPDVVAFKTRHIDARVAVVQSLAHVEKYKSRKEEIPKLCYLVVYREDEQIDASLNTTRADGSVIQVIKWSQFLELGAANVGDDILEQRVNQIQPEDCAAVVFTSGTTGMAKATMLSHDNLNFCFKSVLHTLPNFAGDVQTSERVLSYLPLSHIAAMQVDVVGPLFTASCRPGNATTYFARPTDLKTGKLVERMRFVRPTLFLGVPLVWERMMEKLQQLGAKMTGLKRLLLTWAKAKALERERNMQMGGTGEVPFGFHLSEVLTTKIKERLGLDQCRHALTGASPIARSTLEFFAALSISIHEGYGASESSGVISMTSQTHHVWGSIGMALEGCEVRIVNANGEVVPLARDLFHPKEEEQGEIWFRGRNVMLGYMASSKGDDLDKIEKKNLEAITRDGWCKTGDKGCMDTRGLIRFTGRFKELIKGKGGEIIAPVPIEESISSRAPAVSKVVVIGDNRDYNIALCTLQQEGANGELPGTGELSGLAKSLSPSSRTTTDAMHDPLWEMHIRSAIVQVNSDEKICLNRAFRVRKFTILPRDFSIERDENTPTLKFKRSVIEQNYKAHIDKLYSTPLDENVDVAYVDCSDIHVDVAERVSDGNDRQMNNVDASTPTTNSQSSVKPKSPSLLFGKL